MKRLALLTAILFVAAAPAQAAINLAGYTFDDNAFADYLHSYSGDPWTWAEGIGYDYTPTFGELEANIVGHDLSRIATANLGDAFNIGFSDNAIFNGAGVDFVLFEVDIPATGMVEIEMGGFTQTYTAVFTGYYTAVQPINVVEIDLDDFGYASGATVDLITLHGLTGTGGWGFDLGAVGALNSTQPIPEPGTLALVGLGLAGLGAIRRRKSR